MFVSLPRYDESRKGRHVSYRQLHKRYYPLRFRGGFFLPAFLQFAFSIHEKRRRGYEKEKGKEYYIPRLRRGYACFLPYIINTGRALQNMGSGNFRAVLLRNKLFDESKHLSVAVLR
jgi:hypothetical protein